MIKKLALLLLLLVVVLIGSISTRVAIIKAVVNVALGPQHQLTQLQQLKWSDGGFKVQHLQLQSENGRSIYTLQNIHFLIPDWSFNRARLTVGKVHVSLAQSSEDSYQPGPQQAISISQLLTQAGQIPLHMLDIAELKVTGSPYPLAVNWLNEAQLQSLFITSSHATLSLSLDHTQTSAVLAALQLTHNDSDQATVIANAELLLTLGRHEHHVSAQGNIYTAKLPALLSHYSPLPEQLVELSGNLSLSSEFQFSDDLHSANGHWWIKEQSSLSATLDVGTKEAQPMIFELAFPTRIALNLNDTAQLTADTLRFSAEGGPYQAGVMGKLYNGECTQGHLSKGGCSAQINALTHIDQLDYQQWQFRGTQARISAQLTLEDQQLGLFVSPDSYLRTTSISSPQLTMNNVQLRPLTALSGQLQLVDQSITINSDQLSVMLPLVEFDKIQVASHFILSDTTLCICQRPLMSTTLATDSLNIRIGQTWLPALSISSEFVLEQNTVAATTWLSSDRQRPLAQAQLQYQPASRSASLTWRTDLLATTPEQPLSGFFSNWPFDWDVQNGQYTANATLYWRDQQLSGDIYQRFSDFSGRFANTAFIELNSELDIQLLSTNRLISSKPVAIAIKSIDVGVPITDISARIGFDSSTNRIELHRITAGLLGGTVSADDATVTVGKPSTMEVAVDRIDIKKALTLAGYDAVQGSGLLSGRLPLLISGAGVQVEQGKLSALKPGGVFKYQPKVDAGDTSVQLVNDALSNYQYNTLDAKVHYDKQGDLDLKISMRGQNPDFNQGQQIHLNLNVTDNIPMLLRSLQAGRTVTELVEQQLRDSQ